MLVPTLDVLGWGRCGLQGVGSSIVGVGDGIVPWDDPVGLTDLGSVGGLGSWGGDDRPAYLMGRLDGGLYSGEASRPLVLTDVGAWKVPILGLAGLDSCLWRTSPRTCLIAWVAVFILMKP